MKLTKNSKNTLAINTNKIPEVDAPQTTSSGASNDTAPVKSAGVLIVDDELANIDLIDIYLQEAGYNVFTANNGEEGFEKLLQNKDDISVILLDRMMPKMNGMEFIKKVKEDDSITNIPIILQTGATLQLQIDEGIAAGAYYYLTKPYSKHSLLSITRTAISSYTEENSLRKDLLTHKTQLHLIKESSFEARTLDDVRQLSTFLANFYPQPERVVHGLSELLLNAVEHGNLGINYDEKSKLMSEDSWLDEVQHRLSLPENMEKKVLIQYKRQATKITLHIKDEGKGFDWHNFMEIQSDRATDNHGRGIALARMLSFDDIKYEGTGNEVICTVLL